MNLQHKHNNNVTSQIEIDNEAQGTSLGTANNKINTADITRSL